MRIALTGGIACGKSRLAGFLRELGVVVSNADAIVHDLEAPGGAAAEAIRARFGTLDRAELAQRVFGDDDAALNARHDLEAILFPLVRARLESVAAVAAKEGKLCVAEIPLLFESHWDRDCDIIACVFAPKEIQIRRLAETRGASRAEAGARLRAQLDVAEKAARSDFVIVNDSTPGHLRDEAKRFVAWLQERRTDGRRNERNDAGEETGAA